MDLLSELNDQQRLAVEHTEGPVLVLAGAGSGKTRVLVYRIAHLLATGRAAPDEVVAVTFTNKAADEMKERVVRLVGSAAAPARVGTFHSLCLRMLRREARRLGYADGFQVFDTDDSLRLVKECLREASLDESQVSARNVSRRISDAKNRGIAPEDAEGYFKGHLSSAYARAYEVYQGGLRRMNAMDFDDLILNVLRLFSLHPERRELWAGTCRHLLVDEYQDTNPPQYHLVRALSSVHGNLCVVGDEDQSIYRFRGADIGNILSFQNDFPGTTIVKLTQNYRSTSSILDAANALVRRNNQRIGKELWTDSGKGDDVRFTLLPGDRDEASFVLGQLQTWRLSGGVLENVAILYRTNAQSRLLEEALSDARIPYRIYGGLRFYDRREVRDLMAYLRLALNPADDVSFRRIVGVPPRGLGAAAMMAVEARATGGAGGQSGAAGGLSGAAGGLSGAAGGLSGAAGGLSGAAGGLSGAAGGLSGAAGGLSGAMAACVKEGRLPSRAAASAGAFLDLIEELREMAKTVTPAHLLRTIIARIDYEGYLRRNDPSDAESRLENVEQLVAAADEAGPDGLQSFLDRASLVSESESCTGDRGVNLMTLHSAKGLEFDVVFLVGLEEGLLPHSRTLEEESDIEEERRLCYVGMTRARRRLHLTAASYRRLYGEPAPSTVSRFIDEIGEENLRRMETPFTSWRREGVASLRRPGRQIALGDEDISRGGDDEDGEGSFGVGARVRHEQFGVGRVLAVEAAPQGQKLTVRFTGGRTMKVLTRYARLEPVRG